MVGVRALLLIALTVFLAACAATPPLAEDGWGVQRRFEGRTPSLLSISEINAGTPRASGEIAAVSVRERSRGRHRIAIAAERGIASTWTTGAALFDVDLDRALTWLSMLAGQETRNVELRLTLMPDHGARAHKREHPAAKTLVIDLLIPMAASPRSRTAAIEAALATGLHEASHVLRPPQRVDRGEDEYHASLVAACYRIGGMQVGDVLDLAVTAPGESKDFTRAHSQHAAQSVKRDLATALGSSRLQGRDRTGAKTLQAFCQRRLRMPAP